MTALIIVSIVLLIIALLLLIRIGVHLEYGEKFTFSLIVFGLKIYSSDKTKNIRERKIKEKKKSSKESKPEEKKENIIKKIYKEKGIEETINLFVYVIKKVLEKLLWFAKRLKIRNFEMNISVVGNDAADTAIKYGGVCSAVYPLIAFIDSNLNFKPKRIDVSADFENKSSSVTFSVDIKAEIIVILAVAISAFCEFIKIRDVYFNERIKH